MSFAVEENHFNVVNTLLTRGAPAISTDSSDLLYAARFGSVDIVKILIDAGSDVNAKDENGQTALMRAAERGGTSIVEALIDA